MLLTEPARKNVKNFLEKIRGTLREMRTARQEDVIDKDTERRVFDRYPDATRPALLRLMRVDGMARRRRQGACAAPEYAVNGHAARTCVDSAPNRAYSCLSAAAPIGGMARSPAMALPCAPR